MTNCPKFAEMQKMFHGKSMTVTKVQPITKTQIVTADVNVMDVNVTTRSKVIEKHVFKDKEQRKTKECYRLREKIVVEKVNGGDNSTNSKNTKLKQKGHPHPWKDGTQPGWVCQICCNPNLGLTTKARVCKSARQEGNPGGTSYIPRSAENVKE